MRDGEAAFCAFMIVLFCIVCFVGGCNMGSSFKNREAIEAGVAEWTIDKQGVRGFRWLPATPAEGK